MVALLNDIANNAIIVIRSACGSDLSIYVTIFGIVSMDYIYTHIVSSYAIKCKRGKHKNGKGHIYT